MFVEKINDKEILNFIKIQLEKGLAKTKVYYVDDNEFKYLYKRKKLLKEIYSKEKEYDVIYLLSVKDFERKTYQDGENYMYLEVNTLSLGRSKNTLQDKRKFRRNFSINKYVIRDFNFSFSLPCNLEYLKFMYKKFGEEYLNALKKHHKKEKQIHLDFIENNHNYVIKELTK